MGITQVYIVPPGDSPNERGQRWILQLQYAPGRAARSAYGGLGQSAVT